MRAFMNLLLVSQPNAISDIGFSMPLLLFVSLVLGLIALAFTSYRFVVGYFFAGMIYWLLVEGLHWVISQFATDWAATDTYTLAVACSLLPLVGLLVVASRKRTTASTNLPTNPRLVAGNRPYMIEKDTDFYQHCVRHTSVTEK